MSQLRAASSTLRVPVTLASFDFKGSFILLGTLGNAAKWKT